MLFVLLTSNHAYSCSCAQFVQGQRRQRQKVVVVLRRRTEQRKYDVKQRMRCRIRYHDVMLTTVDSYCCVQPPSRGCVCVYV